MENNKGNKTKRESKEDDEDPILISVYASLLDAGVVFDLWSLDRIAPATARAFVGVVELLSRVHFEEIEVQRACKKNR